MCARVALFAMMVACLSGYGAVTAESADVRVTTGCDTLSWNTIVPGDGRVPSWDWPEGARFAVVRIRRSDGTDVERRIDREGTAREGACPLDLPCPMKPADEAVLEFSVAFFAAEGGTESQVGAGLVARGVGLVGGTGGAGADVLPTGTANARWSLVDCRTPVLPVPEGTASVTAGERTLELTHVPGWVALPALQVGASISLSLAGELSSDVSITRTSTGLTVILR
ncbi:MAG: hypothetical protein Q4G65_15140 [bacterium]|nr:hypothetical protein [bacterium]